MCQSPGKNSSATIQYNKTLLLLLLLLLINIIIIIIRYCFIFCILLFAIKYLVYFLTPSQTVLAHFSQIFEFLKMNDRKCSSQSSKCRQTIKFSLKYHSDLTASTESGRYRLPRLHVHQCITAIVPKLQIEKLTKSSNMSHTIAFQCVCVCARGCARASYGVNSGVSIKAQLWQIAGTT